MSSPRGFHRGFGGIVAITIVTRAPVDLQGLGLLLVFLPLVPFNFVDHGLAGAAAPAARYVPFAVALGVCILSFCRLRPEERSAIAIRFGTYSVVLVLGSIDLAADPVLKAVYYLVTGELIWFLLQQRRISSTAIEWLLGLGVGAAFVVAVAAVAEAVFGFSWFRELFFHAENPRMVQFSDVEEERAVSTIGNPNPMGTYLALMCPFFLFGILCSTKRSRVLALGIGFAAILAALLLSFSRGAWLAFGISSGLFCWLRSRLVAVACVGLAAATLVVSVETGRVKNPYVEYIENFDTDHRFQAIGHSLEVWSTSPLIGIGTGRYLQTTLFDSKNDTPDNMYLLALCENGVVGVLARLWLLLYTLSLLVRCARPHEPESVGDRDQSRERLLAWAFFASLVGFLANMATWDALYFPVTRTVFWILAGLAVALCGNAVRDDYARR